jgi:hypothetical protein
MIRIAISPAAFDAICASLPVGSVAVEAEPNERGERSDLPIEDLSDSSRSPVRRRRR